MCTSNVHFFGDGMKHSSETQSQSRYERDDYESLATRVVLVPMQWVAEKSALSPQRKAIAEVTRSRGHAVTVGVKTHATLTQRAVRTRPTPKRLTVVNLAGLSLVP